MLYHGKTIMVGANAGREGGEGEREGGRDGGM